MRSTPPVPAPCGAGDGDAGDGVVEADTEDAAGACGARGAAHGDDGAGGDHRGGGEASRLTVEPIYLTHGGERRPITTRAELIDRLRNGHGGDVCAPACAMGSRAGRRRGDGVTDHDGMDTHGEMRAALEAADGATRHGGRRRSHGNVADLVPRRGAKRPGSGSVHEEFGRGGKFARGVGSEGARGMPPIGRVGGPADDEFDGAADEACRADARAAGGTTSGTTTAVVTWAATVPSSATAVSFAQSGEPHRVATAEVPARRRIRGKQSGVAVGQRSGLDRNAGATPRTASSGARGPPLPVGRSCGLTGRPPD